MPVKAGLPSAKSYAVLSFVIPYLEWQTVLCALVIRLRKDKRVVALPRLKKKMKKKP